MTNFNLNKVNTARALAISFGIVYVWFGILKFFPGLSPAEGLAKDTISKLTFNTIPSGIAIILLAIWEVVIGILFLVNRFKKIVILLGLVHICLTFTPLFFFPSLGFTEIPYAFTLVGQYIVKNIVFIVGFIILYQEEWGKG